MIPKIRLLLIFTLLLASYECFGQRWAISTNAVQWANLGTINGEVSVAVHKNFTLHLNARYNPWSFKKGEDDILKNRKRAASFGFRAWPWVANSGWWITAAGQWMEYSRSGFGSSKPEDGYALGGVLGFGYSLMITPHFNLDFGVSLWSGVKEYATYDCPTCGAKVDSGRGWFILPDDVKVSAVYIF